MKRLWIYVHAAIASMAWIFVLLALALALLDPKSALNQDPLFAAIAIFVAVGHLSSASYLVRRIREEIFQTKRAGSHRPAEPSSSR